MSAPQLKRATSLVACLMHCGVISIEQPERSLDFVWVTP